MDVPVEQLRTHGPIVEDVARVPDSAEAVSAYGRSRGLERLASLPGLARLWLSGVTAGCLQALGPSLGIQELVIHDFRLEALRALPEMPALRSLAVAGSSKLRSLDGIDRYPRLRQLILFDCPNYEDLAPLQGLHGLAVLCLEGGFSKPLKVRSLAPLALLSSLETLRLASIRVADKSLRPLAGLSGLRSVFIAATFPAPELRYLADALPLARGQFLDSARARGAVTP